MDGTWCQRLGVCAGSATGRGVGGRDTYDVVPVVVVQLLHVGVDEGLQAIALPLDDEFPLARLELRPRQEHVLDQGQDTVALDFLGGGHGLADLLEDGVRVV